MKAGNSRPMEDVGWLNPHSPFTSCEAASLPLAVFECQVHQLPIPPWGGAFGRLGILGCGRFLCKLSPPA